MIKIGLITPDETDALAFYRSTGPLTHLIRNHPEFEYQFIAGTVSWATLRKFDLIFIQRPWLAEHVQICELANKWSVPIIADFDDWLLDLPVSNPAYDAFNRNKKNITHILNLVDSIIVATDKLKTLTQSVLLDQKKPIHVIPNAYDKDLFKKYRHDGNIKPRNKYFAWRGGNSHMQDLMSVKQDYLNLFDSFPDWDFIFIAQHPWFFESKAKNVKTADPLKIIEYFRALHDTAPSIVAHPLFDCDFNRAKSMCSWLEATHARAAFIGPDFEEFQRDGVTRYTNNFFEVAADLLSNPEKIVSQYEASERYIQKYLSLDVVNLKRVEAFKQLLQTR